MAKWWRFWRRRRADTVYAVGRAPAPPVRPALAGQTQILGILTYGQLRQYRTGRAGRW